MITHSQYKITFRNTNTLSLTRTQVQTFNGMYCAAGGGYVYKSDAMPPNMSEYLAWRQTMSQVSELERRSAWLVLSRSQLGSSAPSHFFQFRDMIVRFMLGVQAPAPPAKAGQYEVPPLATYVMFEREARECLFSHSLTQRSHSCHLHNP